MKCVCTKCGRKNEVSVADLRLQHGVVVCPQCLSTFKVPVPKGDNDTPPPVPKRRQKSVSSPKTATAATKISKKSPTRPAAPKRTSSRSTATPRPRKTAKVAASTSMWDSMTKLGCLTWTVGVTCGFFLLYYLLGLMTN